MDTYFIFDQAEKTLEAAKNSEVALHLLYGGYHLFKEEKAKIIDFKKSRHIRNSQVVIINPQHALSLKPRNKVILININSNHILARNKGWLKERMIRAVYNSCDIIVCLDKSQIKPLKDLGIKSKLVVNPLFIDTEILNIQLIRRQNELPKHFPYYLSSGYDAGRNFWVFNEIDSIIPVVTIGRHNIIPYDRYCWFLAGCSGMVLCINNGPTSSDLSGNTTVLDALCAEIPVFINPQDWLVNVPSKNIYVYKNPKELEDLLNRQIQWVPESAKFTFDIYLEKLKKILKIR